MDNKNKTLSYKKVLEKKLFFKYLLLANTPSVYALVNHKDKRVFIGTSNDPITALGNHLGKLANRTHPIKKLKQDRNKLQIQLLCSCEPKYKEAYKLQQIALFKSQGYTLYNIENIPQYKARIRLMREDIVGDGYKVTVQLVNKGRRIFNVKGFDNMSQAEEWLKVNNEIWMLLKMAIDNNG